LDRAHDPRAVVAVIASADAIFISSEFLPV
jgi:hypothetical protein